MHDNNEFVIEIFRLDHNVAGLSRIITITGANMKETEVKVAQHEKRDRPNDR